MPFFQSVICSGLSQTHREYQRQSAECKHDSAMQDSEQAKKACSLPLHERSHESHASCPGDGAWTLVTRSQIRLQLGKIERCRRWPWILRHCFRGYTKRYAFASHQ